MLVQVTVEVPDIPGLDEYYLAGTMANSVNGEIVSYDFSSDGQFWTFGGDRVEGIY